MAAFGILKPMLVTLKTPMDTVPCLHTMTLDTADLDLQALQWQHTGQAVPPGRGMLTASSLQLTHTLNIGKDTQSILTQKHTTNRLQEQTVNTSR